MKGACSLGQANAPAGETPSGAFSDATVRYSTAFPADLNRRRYEAAASVVSETGSMRMPIPIVELSETFFT